MSKLWNWLKEELTLLAPVALVFFLLFSLLRLMEFVIIGHIISHGFHIVVIGTLLVSKVFLTLENLKFMNQFSDGPLFYSTLWKTLFYSIGTLTARFCEYLTTNSLEQAMDQMARPRTLIVQIWVSIFLFIYCFTRDLSKKLGPDKFKKMVWG